MPRAFTAGELLCRDSAAVTTLRSARMVLARAQGYGRQRRRRRRRTGVAVHHPEPPGRPSSWRAPRDLLPAAGPRSSTTSAAARPAARRRPRRTGRSRAPAAGAGRGFLAVRDAPPGGHQVQLAGPDHLPAAEAVAVQHQAFEQPAHGLSGSRCGWGGTIHARGRCADSVGARTASSDGAARRRSAAAAAAAASGLIGAVAAGRLPRFEDTATGAHHGRREPYDGLRAPDPGCSRPRIGSQRRPAPSRASAPAIVPTRLYPAGGPGIDAPDRWPSAVASGARNSACGAFPCPRCRTGPRSGPAAAHRAQGLPRRRPVAS